MRRSIAFSLILFAAACAPRPQATSVPTVTPTAPPSQLGGLYGLNVQELAGRFGKPALQIHEGSSVKLQSIVAIRVSWRGEAPSALGARKLRF